MLFLLRSLAPAIVAILVATAAAAQAFPNPPEVERYVRAIHEQIETHGRGDLPYPFFLELNRLSARFELPELPLETSRRQPPETFAAAADSLLRALGPADAFREATLRDSASDDDTRAAVRADMLQSRTPHDHDATVALIRADPHPGVRAQGIRYALIYRIGVRQPDFDAMLAEGLSSAFAMPEGEWRTRVLNEYADLCTREARPPCADHDLPRTGIAEIHMATGVLNAAHTGDLALADSLLAELEAGGMSEPGLLALVSTALARPCSAGSGCAVAIAPLRERWLPRLRTFAASTLPQADTVRANLVVVIASLDAALDLHRAVQDSALAERAAWTAAQSVHPTDFWTAVELMRNNIRRGWSNQMVGAIYLRLMAMGENDLAAEILASDRSSSSRLWNRLQWVEALHRVGRVDEARTTALAALDDWDTATDPLAGSNILRIYDELAIYPQLIDWAWSRPEGPARAGALLSVLQGQGRVE